MGNFINPADFGSVPVNFIIRQTLPQQKLLKHVQLFITHAGMNSVNEAVYYGVPMLLLPHTVEQKLIAARIKQLTLGKVMDIRNVTAQKLYQNAAQLINDSTYKKQGSEYKVLFRSEEKMSHIKAADAILGYISGLR